MTAWPRATTRFVSIVVITTIIASFGEVGRDGWEARARRPRARLQID